MRNFGAKNLTHKILQVAERENLLGKLSEYVSTERKTFNSSGAVYQISGVPKTINSIYFVRQLEAKIKDILKTGLCGR